MNETETGTGGAGGSETQPPKICRVPAPHQGPWLTEVTSELGLGKTDALEPVGTSVVAADVDADGWLDFYTASFPAQREPAGTKRTRFLFMNRPSEADPQKRVFVDATDASGLLATRDGVGGRGLSNISFADIDNDGDLDAFGCPSEVATTTLDGCAAFLNDGSGLFSLAPAGGDLESDVFSMATATTLDFDRDGIIDFWPGTIGQWQYGPALTSHPRLYRGIGDGTFIESSAQMGLPQTLTGGQSDYRMNFGNVSCDFDVDGDRDVLVGNYGVPIGPNYIFRNDGAAFTDVAAALGLQQAGVGGFTFSITCGDIDDDGDQDLMTAEVAHPGGGTDKTALLLNQTAPGQEGMTFERVDGASIGMGRAEGDMEGDNIALFADVDLDGKKDIFIAGSNYPQQYAGDPEYTHAWLYRQGDDGHFEDVTPQTPFGDPLHQTLEGPSLMDYDNDGDLDLFIGTGLFNSTYVCQSLGLCTNTLHVYRNDIGQSANFVRVRLVGAGAGRSNRAGIGARVEVTAGGRTQHQEVLGAWGHSQTQNDVLLTFGLGAACEVDQIVVRWPDAAGTVTTLTEVLANYLVEISEADEALRYVSLDGVE